jgi:hypothetical protein
MKLQLAGRCLEFIAHEVKIGIPGVLGIQVCNEAIAGIDHVVFAWYNDVLDLSAKIDTALPVHISDTWNLGRVISYSKQRNSP